MNIFKRISLFLVLLLLAGTFWSCDLVGSDDSEKPTIPVNLQGTWFLESTFNPDYSELWVIGSDSISYSYANASKQPTSPQYTAIIVKVVSGSLNGGDTTITSGGSSLNLGYAVIKFQSVADDTVGVVGKYQIFRWADTTTDTAKKDFTQGYKDATPNDGWTTWPNTVFDSAGEAEANATIANEHFAGASSGAIKQ